MSTEKTTPTTADSSGKCALAVITENTPSIVSQIPLKQLEEFKFHAFKIYTGERLEQLTESIRANGIINPVTVRPKDSDGKFEIINGHNRVKAAEAAGLTSVPAIVRELNDDEAIILANESNIVQRNFKSWLPSERVASIFQYHAAIKRQGVKVSDSSGGIPQKGEYAREKTARVYGIAPNSVRLNIELHRLDAKLMERLDNNDFGISAAQNLSSTHKEVQRMVDSILDEEKAQKRYSVTVANSKAIKDEFLDLDSNELRERKAEIKGIIRNLLDSSFHIPDPESKSIGIDFPVTEYRLLFGSASTDQAVATIIAAVKRYQNDDSIIESQIEGTLGEMGETTQASAS